MITPAKKHRRARDRSVTQRRRERNASKKRRVDYAGILRERARGRRPAGGPEAWPGLIERIQASITCIRRGMSAKKEERRARRRRAIGPRRAFVMRPARTFGAAVGDTGMWEMSVKG